ncbi:RFG1 [[Candida] subhashii]|uniref:RFG1 n=1 Tax=[Candida] subhashii TaxID=561895 RepID=A0A8J5QEZ1_9ASCO|nr:RFG1 [[Candida] subhashii]KAG7663291.1 RFG1 [[Candida] subhashii]
MPVEDLPTKHTLPSLSQIMPPVQQSQSASSSILSGGQSQYSHDSNSNNGTNSPSSTNTSPNLKYNTQQPQPVHQVHSIPVGVPTGGPIQPQHTQSLPDLYSQSSTAQTTPGSSYTPYGQQQMQQMQPQQQPVIGGVADGNTTVSVRQDKCICKSNANRIPRPRNAFILFRQKYHQTVLDEGSVIRTNPEVSRELGRRWRALSPEEKEHWNNLAEEEKKNHAKKYPGYRYTPRRNGKNKNCLVCREKALKQQQQQQQQVQQVKQAQLVQMQNQQMMQIQQDQQYYLQLQQQQQYQQQMQHQQSQQQVPLNGYQQHQYIISPSPYQQNLLNGPNGATTLPLPQQQQQPNQPPQLQFYEADKLSPLSNQQQQQAQHHQLSGAPSYSGPQSTLQHPAGSGNNEYTISGNGYDTQRYSNVGAGTATSHLPQQQQQQHASGNHGQAAGASSFGFDSFAIPQPPQ